MAKEFKLTRERLKELEEELNYLKTTREKEVAEQIKEARSFGDLSENSEYDEAKNEQAKLYGRIAEVENILSHAVVIDESAEQERAGVVGLGCTVKVRDLDLEEEATYAIVSARRRPTPWSLAFRTTLRSAAPCLASTSARPSKWKPRSARSVLKSFP